MTDTEVIDVAALVRERDALRTEIADRDRTIDTLTNTLDVAVGLIHETQHAPAHRDDCGRDTCVTARRLIVYVRTLTPARAALSIRSERNEN